MKKIILYAIMCMIWGTTWMAIKIGLEDLTPIFSLGLRLLTAGIVIAIYLLIRDRKIKIELKQTKLIVYIMILNYIIPYLGVYWGEQYIYSNLAAIIIATHPINISLLSNIFLKEEKFTLRDNISILFGFAGILMIFSDTFKSGLKLHIFAVIAIFISSLSFSIIDIIMRKKREEYHPLKINLFPILISGILLTGISPFFENISKNNLTFSSISSVLYLSIFGTIITYTILFWLIQRIKLNIVTLSTFIIPIIATITGWVFLDEALSGFQIFGAFFVLLGVLINTVKRKPEKTIE